MGGPALTLQAIHDRLLAHYGRQGWWPADGPFEVMVGAILTQNTAWRNVERAIAALKREGWLDPDTLRGLPHDELAPAIRPAGYFNVKAQRLQALCDWYLAQGGVDALSGWETRALREGLLEVRGVGRETADDILLYAFHRPVFVIDAYTRRLFSRLGQAPPDPDRAGYETWRGFFEARLPTSAPLFNEYHALIVRHGKDVCQPRPRCQECILATVCASAHQDP